LILKDEKDPLLDSGEDTNEMSDKLDPEDPQNPGYISMKKTNMRWCMLLMACFFMFGNTFCYDSPGPMETQLQKQLDIDATRYSLLYSVYSMPNMVLPVFGGILLDSMGVRFGLVLFCAILTIGQAVFMIGGY
jgi:MFS family permease